MLGFRLNKLGAAMRGNRPIVDEWFTDSSKTLDPRITFSRASSATYFDSTGTLQTASSGVARAHAFQDHDPSTLTPLGFLIEEQRTNLCIRSEEFDNASWAKTDTTITANSIASPAGTTTADLFTEGSAGTAITQSTAFNFSAGNTLAISCFFKRGGSTPIQWQCMQINTAGGTTRVWADVQNGVIGSNNASAGTHTFVSKSLQTLPNGWYRLTLVVTVATDTSATLNIKSASADASNTRVNNATYYAWGADAEVGAFVTSYIATTTAAATRLADSASITGANFSSFWNSVGSIFIAARKNVGTTGRLLLIDNGTSGLTTNGINVDAVSAVQLRSEGFTSGVAQWDVRATYAQEATAKVSLAFDTNNIGLVANGAAAATDTSATVPTTNITTMAIGHWASSNQWNGWIGRLAFYRTRLAEATQRGLTA